MAVEKMSMVTVGGPMEQLNRFITECCLDGSVQCEQAMDHISSSMDFASISEENIYAPRLTLLNELAALLNVSYDYVMNAGPADDGEMDETYIAGLLTKIKTLLEKRNRLQAEITRCGNAIESLSYYAELDVPLNDITECEFIKVRFGHMPQQSFDKLELFRDNLDLAFYPYSHNGEDVWGVYFAPLDKAAEIDRMFASLYFERLFIPDSKDTPKRAIENYKRQIERYTLEREELGREISRIWQEESRECNLIYSRLVQGNVLYEIRSNVAVYRDYFCFIGWVPKKEVPSFRVKIGRIPTIDVEVEDAENLGDGFLIPTKLKSNRFARPYKEFVEMYGMPGYREFDPTTFLAIVYTLVFGIMFADLGQGLTVAALGLLLWFKNKSRMGGILFRCGLSSALFGTLIGSVFGFEQALTPFYQRVFHLAGKPIDVMEDINFVLLVAIGIGVALMFVAMGIHIYASLRRRRPGEALFSQNGLAGAVTYAGGVLFVVKFMNNGRFSGIRNNLCFSMILCGAVLLFFKELLIGRMDGHKREDYWPESWTDFILSNFFELIEYMLSYFSNTVSFLRIGAFVLVHAGMMEMIFNLAPIGGIGRYLVIVIGNVVVMGLEGVLTYIQALRLNFYEMFSRFYQGDGQEFKGYNLYSKLKAKSYRGNVL